MTEKTKGRSLGQRLNDLIAPFAPSLALGREVALTQRAVLRREASNYQGAGRGSRGKDFRYNRNDAVEAGRGDRDKLSWISRDMLRNNPRVVKIRRQLMNNVVGAGIQPSVRWLGGQNDERKATVESLIRRHCLTTMFDTDGKLSILGQQGLGFGTIVTDGEVLFRRRQRRPSDGFPLNFQVQVLEADYLNRDIDGKLRNGNYAVQGIEFDGIGRRIAYHLYDDHPGGRRGAVLNTRRIDARNIVHAFDVNRAGQQRGVSWLAPVITLLHELQKYQDGQVKRQEIAALFAGVLQTSGTGEELERDIGTLTAGTILTVGENESMEFTNPPAVDGYEPFMRVTDRTIAAAMGITYEALTGDYSNVNYTSGRMGRMDVDPNVRDWQQNLMIAQVCDGIGAWVTEAIADVADVDPALYELAWTPPVRPVIDPTKDFKADEIAMLSGQKSRRQTIRERGHDPAKIEAEIVEERSWAKDNAVVFSSDAATKTAAARAEPDDDAKKPNKNGDDDE